MIQAPNRSASAGRSRLKPATNVRRLIKQDGVMEAPNIEKLMAAIVTWVVGQGSYVTKTKLLKLLYLFDVEYYRAHRQTFTGFGWKFFHLGPWAAAFDPALDQLVNR